MSAPKKLTHDADIALVCDLIATDAATLFELIETLIGDCNEAGNQLAAANMMVARMGMLADTIAAAHGGKPFRRDAMDWMVNSGRVPDAIRALTEPARATRQGQAAGGAA